jgi:hypothetical protein
MESEGWVRRTFGEVLEEDRQKFLLNNYEGTTSRERGSAFKIFDEHLLELDLLEAKIVERPNNSLEAVIAEYRNLRENYEYYLKYEEAGQFFIREMELRRRYEQMSDRLTRKKKWYERFFTFSSLYFIVSDYGESTRRPLAITISVFFIATLYFWYTKGWTMNTISESISRTATAFFPFFSLPEGYELLDVILRASMIPMAGLLFIALRRKLERKFRH